MELPARWRDEVGNTTGLLIIVLMHPVLAAAIVIEAHIWGMLPRGDSMAHWAGQAVTLGLFLPLLLADLLLLKRLWENERRAQGERIDA